LLKRKCPRASKFAAFPGVHFAKMAPPHRLENALARAEGIERQLFLILSDDDPW
jgi:hypothetical protein